MRAKMPSKEGFVDRNGVRLHYEVYGDGPETIVFLPPWSIVHARVYKAQLPYFSERFRCVTYDGRGNGKSDRPEDVAAYSLSNYAADALAVMDATGTGDAILVGLSFGGLLACILAAHHPDRVKAAILAGTGATVGPNHPHMTVKHFQATFDSFEGWDKCNRAYWLSNYPDFADHFIRHVFTEPHSTRQIEEGIDWAGDTSGAVLAKTWDARTIVPEFDVSEAMYRKIRCPMLVLHGDNDQIQPHARGKVVAELSGAELVTFPGGGHNLLGRYPAKCNALISEFLDRRLGLMPARSPPARAGKARRVLYLSSPIGLGHGRRDIAIARELRKLHPDLQVDWLAQDPVTRLLEANGETIHPLSSRLASESRHIELESGEHDLHAFQAIRRMDEVLITNFMIFQDAVETGSYDLVIADEAWDIDHYWHEHPELKKAPLAWFTDFVGYLPMPEGGEHEAFLTGDYNAEMIEHIERHPADDARVGSKALRLRRLYSGRTPCLLRHTRGSAREARLRTGRAHLYRHRRRVGRRRPSHPPHLAELPDGKGEGAGVAHDCGGGPADRSALAWRTRGRGGTRLRSESRLPSGGVRSRSRPGRADDMHGARGRRNTLHLLSAQESF
jgi:pimeloyl-ACP methyl ester carboxylesterase